jgi:hypothetical protein
MALTNCPAFHRQQRSVRKMRQDLSWAFARSPGERSTRADSPARPQVLRPLLRCSAQIGLLCAGQIKMGP